MPLKNSEKEMGVTFQIFKGVNQIQDWQMAYPESVVNNREANEKFTELALMALGGRVEEQENKFRDKIIRNVLKEVVLTNNYKN